MGEPMSMGEALNQIAEVVHTANRKWWVDLSKPCPNCVSTYPAAQCTLCYGFGYLPKDRNVGELLMLVVTELSEAMEGHRKDLMDDKLPHRKMLEVELADALIRILDIGAGLGMNLGGAFVEKMQYNARRADHKIENRLQPGGKKY